MKIIQILVVLIYIGLVMVIAYISKLKTKGLDGYLRPRLGPWVVAFTGFATAFSTSLLVVGASFGYKFGAVVQWIAVPQALGLAALYLIYAPRMITMVDSLGSLTIPEFLGDRYKSDAIRAVSSVIMFIFCVGYLIVIFRGLGVVFTGVFGIPYNVGVIIAGVLGALYVSYGGQLAVANTDLLQGWIMTIGLLILIPLAIIRGGGMSAIHANIAQISPALIETPGNFAPGILLGLILVFSLGMLGQPQLIYRIMFIKRKKDIPVIAVITVIISLIACWISYYSGVIAKVLLPTALSNSDMAMPALINYIFNPVFAAILATAMTAAAMSSTDSLIIMAAGSIARDIYQKIINPDYSDKSTEKLTRVLAIMLGMSGMLMALKPPSWFLYLMGYVWAVWAATYMFPLLYGLFWKGVTAKGALFGMIMGPATAVIWQVAGKPFGLHALFPSLLVSIVIIPLVSSFTPKLPAEFIDMLFNDGVKVGGQSRTGISTTE